MRLTEKSKECIRKLTGLPFEVIQLIDSRALQFYFQNTNRIKIEREGNEILYTILDKRLKRKIRRVSGKKKDSQFYEEDINNYLNSIDYRGLPIDISPRIDSLPIMPRETEVRFI
jgi:hypothetical protein